MMKKLISLLLIFTMMAAMLAGCGSKTPETPEVEQPTETTPVVAVPGSALEILETVWALYGDDEKFPVVGGDMNNMVDGAPGSFAVTDAEGLAYYFYLLEEQIANVDDAASMLHGMMLNNFTCGVFHVKEDAEGFAKVLQQTLEDNQWICGMPEKMVIAVIGGEYVLMTFGINDAVNPFEAKLQQAYPEAQIICSQAIA